MNDQTQQLAAALAAYADAPIPEDVRLVARSSVLDWIGVSLAAAYSEPVNGLRSVLGADDVAGPSMLVTGGRTSAALAARINGTAGHVLDFDDVLASFGHPTVPVLPAALALAGERDFSGDALLRAFIAGIETESRVSDMVGAKHYELGFHATATLGIFGSAAASAMLLGLDAGRAATALGLASISSSGLKSAFGSWGKSLQTGHAAAEGVIAAQLARVGAQGPGTGLGGSQGFLHTHRVPGDPSVVDGVLDDIGEWRTRGILFKYHASCYGTHSSIESLLRLRSEAGGADVREVRLAVSPRHIGMCDQVDVASGLAGKFSLAFTSALAWQRGSAGEADFYPEAIADRSLQQLAGRVQVIEAPERDFSTTGVEVDLADGRTLSSAIDMSIPASADELVAQWNRLEAKVRNLLEPLLPVEHIDRLVELAARVDTLPEAAELVDAIAAAGAALPTTVRNT